MSRTQRTPIKRGEREGWREHRRTGAGSVMHWKTINGKQYAYMSLRIGDRVISRYVGSGERAELFARVEAVRQDRRLNARLRERQHREADAESDRRLDELVARVQAEAVGYLHSRGFHRPKRGVWRKRRCLPT